MSNNQQDSAVLLAKPAVGHITKSYTRKSPATRLSRGGLDEINPDDVIYGEYVNGQGKTENYIDLVYLNDEVLRAYSGPISTHHSLLRELRVLLRVEDSFYLVLIKELPLGFAFKHVDILSIDTSSVVDANANHDPSCVWTLHFKNGNRRTLEIDYQAYFAYGKITRPASMTNAFILDKVLAEDGKR